MAFSLEPTAGAAFASSSSANVFWYAFLNGGGPYASATYANNPDLVAGSPDDSQSFSTLSNVNGHVPIFTGTFAMQASQHTDYHYRVWTIPRILTLSNPTLGADIPFFMWNTFDSVQTLQSISTDGSSVLSFDVNVGNAIADFQLREVNMQIAPGEPTIDALVLFNFNSGSTSLQVQAVVAETFPILPEVPVNETWEFKTDVLTSYTGAQQRIALMPDPRVTLDFNVRVVDYEERRVLYGLTSSNIKVPSLIPMFQYASQITSTTAVGETRLYFDPKTCNTRVGGFLIALNRVTQATVLGTVTEVHEDGATINAAAGEEVSSPLWFAVPGISCYLEDGSGLNFGAQAGDFNLKAQSLQNLELRRPGATNIPTEFDSMPVVEKPFLITATEKWVYRRDLIDGGVGSRSIKAADDHFFINRTVKFSVARDDDSMDYWRELFASVNGGQKPFLLETQLPDLTLVDGHDNATGLLTLNEGYYFTKLYPLDTFKRVKIKYTDGTYSHHVVSNASATSTGGSDISVSPAIDEDKIISRISYLHKVRADDKVTIQHYNNYSELKFNVRTVNE